jgi:hypothetical protein
MSPIGLSVPNLYIKNVIEPTLRRFEAEPTSLELAFATCIFISHIADVIKEHSGDGLASTREKITAHDHEFAVLSAFAIAAKHVKVTDGRYADFMGLHLDDAEIASGAAFSDGTYFSDGTSFAEHPDTVRIQTPDGHYHDLLFCAQSVVKSLNEMYPI